jgi:hypothetical protein
MVKFWVLDVTLTRIRLTPKQISAKLLYPQNESFSPEQITAIMNILPTAEEVCIYFSKEIHWNPEKYGFLPMNPCRKWL